MHRRTLITAALALAAAGCTSAPPTPSPSPSATPTGPRPRATIGLSYIPNVQFAPFYVGQDARLFDTVNATVSLRHHGATEGLFNALVSGAEDFLVAAGCEAMQARAEGVDVIAVGAYYKAFPVSVIVLGDSPISALADLKGRSLGVPGKFGETWLAVQVALKSAGLTERDVKITEVGFTQVAALTTKKVDAVVGFSTNEFLQLQAAAANPRSMPVASGVVPLVSTCLLTSQAYAEANPEVVKQVVAAVTSSIETTAADPAKAVTVAATQIPGWTEANRANAEVVLVASVGLMGVNQGVFDPALDAPQWQSMADFLGSNELISKPVAASDAYTNAYVA